jgi:hypothetical protein
MDDSPDSDANIEIRLGRPQQLFNSFDPSPFHERDLDEDAEAYIVDSVDEFPLQKRLRLIIQLPADQLPAGNVPDLPQAIHNYLLSAGSQCAGHWRFFCTTGGRSGAAVRYSPSSPRSP